MNSLSNIFLFSVIFWIRVCFGFPLLINQLSSVSASQDDTTGVVKPESSSKVRFRKRDKIRFYTRKMIRKAKEFKDEILPYGMNPEGNGVGRSGRRNRRRGSTLDRYVHVGKKAMIYCF